MKKFLIIIPVFLSVNFILFELTVRIFNLTNDVPQRNLIDGQYQLYKNNQEGVYKNARWKVNAFGFLGLSDINNGENQVLLIGDSFLENMMNNIECNIGSQMKLIDGNLKVFEIARSGMTLIEYFEFYKKFKQKIKPAKTIFLVNSNDIYESISNFNRFPDRIQIDLNENKINRVDLKYPTLKKVLYNLKGLYYLYSSRFLNFNFPKLIQTKKIITKKAPNKELIEKLFIYLRDNYSPENISFICYNMKDIEVNLFRMLSNNIYQIEGFDEKEIRKDDRHWNCLGNQKVAELILDQFIISK
tara:strand:+ start:104 stop:1006 length:903 start_codon:yes stop_codon:yes gene_type:complete